MSLHVSTLRSVMEVITKQQIWNVKNVLPLVILPENVPGIHFSMRILVKSAKKGELNFITQVIYVGSQIHVTKLLLERPAPPLLKKRAL